MTCPTELECSLYVDGVLSERAAGEIERHVRDCGSCTARVAALAGESRMLRNALALDEETVAVPRFERPLGALGLLAIGAGAALSAWLAAAAWQALLDRIPAELDWLNPFHVGALWDLFVTAVLFVFHEGTPMIDDIVTSAGIASLVVLAAGAAFAARTGRAGAALAGFALLVMIVLPSTGHAIDIRRGTPLMTVGPGETIDDTLVVSGDSATIDGTVNGDLIAFTRTLTVRGTVTGDIVGFAQSIDIEGGVGGTVYGFAESVDVRGQIAHNVFGFARAITIGDGANVNGNATLFTNTSAVRGRVGRDVTAFTADIEISGVVERDVSARAGRVRVVERARIGGGLRAITSDADNVQVAPGVTIGGGTDIDVREELEEERPEYFDLSFYVWQVVRVAAAFVMGLLLFWLAPGLRALRIDSVATAFKAGGLGLAAVLLLPIVSVIAFVTIIGIPLGIGGVFVWLLGLYFAKIVVALIVGRRLFETRSGELPHHAPLLIAGLVVVTIAVNLPFIGRLLNLVLVLLGFGLLVLHFAGYYRDRGSSLTTASM